MAAPNFFASTCSTTTTKEEETNLVHQKRYWPTDCSFSRYDRRDCQLQITKQSSQMSSQITKILEFIALNSHSPHCSHLLCHCKCPLHKSSERLGCSGPWSSPEMHNTSAGIHDDPAIMGVNCSVIRASVFKCKTCSKQWVSVLVPLHI